MKRDASWQLVKHDPYFTTILCFQPIQALYTSTPYNYIFSDMVEVAQTAKRDYLRVLEKKYQQRCQTNASLESPH